MFWDEFEKRAPELAAEGAKRFESHLLGFLGTARRDGSPRICPVETILAGGRLCLGMAPDSRKAVDLRRDPRCTVHSIVTNRNGADGEFKLSGRALEIDDEEFFAVFAGVMEEKVGWRPRFKQGFFVNVDIASASYSHSPSRKLTVWDETRGLREGRPA